MRHFIARHKRWSALGVIALVPAVVAAAYMLATSHSSKAVTSNTNIAAPAPVTLTVTSTLATASNGGSSPGPWQYGYSADASEHLTNPSANTVSVQTLSLASWTSDVPACNSVAFPALFTATPVALNTTIAAGATITAAPITVSMVDDGLNDTACAGATPTFVFSTS